MIDYERSQCLLKFFRVKNMLFKHWSKITNWKMTEHLHLIVLRRLTKVVQSTRIISISANEVIVIDYTSD